MEYSSYAVWRSGVDCCRYIICNVTDYTAILDVYTLEQILELNDLTEEEALDYLVTQGFLSLPLIKPLDFE